jgi:hypothetical protein
MDWSDKNGFWGEWTIAADPDEVMALVSAKGNVDGVVDIGGVDVELMSGEASRTSRYDVPGGDALVISGHTATLSSVIRKWRLAQGKVGLQVVVPAEQVAELRAIAAEKGWQIR